MFINLPNNFNKRPDKKEAKYSCFFMKLFICNHHQKKHQVSSKNLKQQNQFFIGDHCM